MPLELAMSLAALALYDTVIYVDDSGTPMLLPQSLAGAGHIGCYATISCKPAGLEVRKALRDVKWPITMLHATLACTKMC